MDVYNRTSVRGYQNLEDEFKRRKQDNALNTQLKQAQIQKMTQPDPFDPKQAATMAIYKQSLGQPLSAEDEAAIRTMSTIEGNKTSWEPNEYGQIVARTQPNPYSTVLDPMQASQQAIGQRQQEIGANPNQGPRSLNDFSIADLKNMNMADMESQLRGTPVEGQKSISEQMPRNPMMNGQTDFEMVNQDPRNYGVPTLGDTGPFFNTPAGNIETGKATVDVQKAGDMLPVRAAEKNIDVVGNLEQFMAQEDYKNAIATANAELATEQGRSKVNSILNRMSEINDALKIKGAIISSDQSLGGRIGASAMTTDAGMSVRKISDPEAQALAEEYEKLQSTLLPYYASAAGLGAKSLDSDGERRAILSSFGGPRGIYEANNRQLGNLSVLFGGDAPNSIGGIIDFNDLPE